MGASNATSREPDPIRTGERVAHLKVEVEDDLDTYATFPDRPYGPPGSDVMVHLLYPDGSERVGPEDDDNLDPHIARMLAHPRVRKLMRMTPD